MDLKKEAARHAVTLINHGNTVGLGAGSTIAYMVQWLKEDQEKAASLILFTSSYSTRQLLLSEGFTVQDTALATKLDLYFDGCDQFDHLLNALKSGGGIHTHEKLLASMANAFVLIGDDKKMVPVLETKYPLVIELIPESLAYVTHRLRELFTGAVIQQRMADKRDGPVLTQNGNYLLDVFVQSWPSLKEVNPMVKSIPGVLETSLFYNIASKAVVAASDGVRVIEKNN